MINRMLVSGKVDIRAGRQEGRLIWADRSATPMGAALVIGGGPSLLKAIDICMTDLRKHWGMVDGALPTPAIAPQPVGNVMGIFRHDDYPEDAIAANQSGSTRFLLMIDERGAVMDCAITESSGVATLDAMGCRSCASEPGSVRPGTHRTSRSKARTSPRRSAGHCNS